MNVFLNQEMGEVEVLQALRTTLPCLKFCLLSPENFHADDSIVLTVDLVDSIYPTQVVIWEFKGMGPGTLSEKQPDIALGRHLSQHFACDALVDGTQYGPDPKNPYYSLLWRSGEAWLADDSVVDPLDLPGKPALLLHRLIQPLPWLAQNGDILLR
jgi:hypothetical protein